MTTLLQMLGGAASLVLATSAVPGVAASGTGTPLRDVVLVHGAFADGSGWRQVFDRLVASGYRVTIVQNPETSVAADVAATCRAIDMAKGPVVLVGHSWGGQIVTEAGAHEKVKALVYLAALAPDVGESTETLESKAEFPPPNNDVETSPDGYFYMDPAKYHQNFAGDSPKELADFMAASQVFLSAQAFKTPAKVAAWRMKPSWAIVPTADKTINPDLERWMYRRAKSTVTEVEGSSHTVFLSHPDVVVKVIEDAANGRS